MTELDLAYTAGIIDGEGCICIHRRTAGSGRSLSPSYSLGVNVTNTEQSLVLWMKLSFGGSYSEYKQSGNRKIAYRWDIYGDRAVQFLETIRSGLKVKRRQADLAIEFQSEIRASNGSAKLPEEALAIREAQAILMNRLNHRGL